MWDQLQMGLNPAPRFYNAEIDSAEPELSRFPFLLALFWIIASLEIVQETLAGMLCRIPIGDPRWPSLTGILTKSDEKRLLAKITGQRRMFGVF